MSETPKPPDPVEPAGDGGAARNRHEPAAQYGSAWDEAPGVGSPQELKAAAPGTRARDAREQGANGEEDFERAAPSELADEFVAEEGGGAPPGAEPPPFGLYPPPAGSPPLFDTPPTPPRDPFWGYHDLFIFLGILPVALFLGAILIKIVFAIFHFKPQVAAMELAPEQTLAYVLLYGGLAALFRVWYDRPLWRSLGWRPMRLPFSLVIVAGLATGIAVAIGASLIHMKDEANPLTDLMQGRTALILMCIFGVTVAPVAEELAFRGFLQPLLVRSVGPAAGIVLTTIPFGLLHYQEYGNSWVHVAIICFAGAAFGVMRQVTGSTKAAALMHASYNALFFIAAFSVGKDFHH